MSYMYQKKNLDLVYTASQHQRESAGRITRQNMCSLKALTASKAPKSNFVTDFAKAISAGFCILFRPKFTNGPQAEVKAKIYSENTSSVFR